MIIRTNAALEASQNAKREVAGGIEGLEKLLVAEPISFFKVKTVKLQTMAFNLFFSMKLY